MSGLFPGERLVAIITPNFISAYPFSILRCMDLEMRDHGQVFVLLLNLRNGVNLKSSSGLYSHRSGFEIGLGS